MRTLLSSVFALGALAVLPAAAPEPAPLRGFTAQSSRVERDWETKFKAIPEPARMRDMMQRLAARPHHVGSPYDKQNAEWIRDQYASYGWDAKIETFDVLFPTPTERVVEMVAPTTYKAVLQEPVVPGDPTTSQRAEQLPTYNAYSVDGDVTGPLVFVNYGVPADYEELERRGISVKGAIVIAKYGGSWRGIKPKVAAEHGAIGCLIYSDPADDGYGGGAVFPKGPMRPPQGVQRGSVADMPTYPGDPLTPGVGATKDAKRLDVRQATTLTKIPVLPISYGDAQPLLAALTGPVVPERWRGGLPITYRFGPGASRVHLKLKFDFGLKTLYDVIARLPGTTEADQWVIRGNHHDAWVNGAEDPIAGQVAELEEARALGALYKQGWRPKRTIIYASWDGEEPGLLGSTEWAETHADSLAEHAVAYLNSDTNGRGYLGVEGSHSLESFINGVEKDIVDPESNVSSWKRNQAALLVRGDPDARAGDLRIGALGSGSDFTPFLQHLGIASMNLGYGGEDNGGIYHSIYDDFYWYTHFSDSTFVYGRALAQAVGTTVMRLASADVLPFVFTNLAETTHRYVDELQKLRDTRAKEIDAERERVADSVYAIVRDPRDPVGAPRLVTPPPRFDFGPLLDAQDSLSAAASRFEKAYAAWRDAGGTATQDGSQVSEPGAANLAEVNRRLLKSERVLLLKDGLKNRPWYKHSLYAPGFYTGYGVKTMPGIREAIEQGEWGDVNGEIARVAKALQDEATLLKEAAAGLKAG
jgi:N-acetylated-alpha-linked acidic dipeptidase